MILQVMPSFYCTQKCNYCYLGDLTNDKTTLSLTRFYEMYKEIVLAGFKIDAIEIYGGSLAHPEAIEFTQNLLKQKDNASSIGLLAYGSNSVSLNVERKDCKTALRYIHFKPHCSVNIVALPITRFIGPKYYFHLLRNFRGYVNFIQHYPAVMAKYNPSSTNKDYCDFMIKVIKEYYKKERPFKLYNINLLEEALSGKYDERMESHLFISPYGKYGCVKYNEEGLEYFKWFDTINEWAIECKLEQLLRPVECLTCPVQEWCMAEHLRPHKKDDECSGLKKLVLWWKEHRNEYQFNS